MPRHPLKQSCGDLAAEGLFQGLLTGSGFGLFFALHQRRLSPEPNATKQVLRAFGQSVLLFSGLLSVYHGCSCLSSRARHGRDDLLNAAVGGACAGVVVSLPTRQPRLVLQNAVGMAVIGLIMDRISNAPVQTRPTAPLATRTSPLRYHPPHSV